MECFAYSQGEYGWSKKARLPGVAERSYFIGCMTRRKSNLDPDFRKLVVKKARNTAMTVLTIQLDAVCLLILMI